MIPLVILAKRKQPYVFGHVTTRMVCITTLSIGSTSVPVALAGSTPKHAAMAPTCQHVVWSPLGTSRLGLDYKLARRCSWQPSFARCGRLFQQGGGGGGAITDMTAATIACVITDEVVAWFDALTSVHSDQGRNVDLALMH